MLLLPLMMKVLNRHDERGFDEAERETDPWAGELVPPPGKEKKVIA